MKQLKQQVFHIVCIIIPFLVILSCFAIPSMKILDEKNASWELKNIAKNLQTAERAIKEDILYKDALTEIYGVVHEAVGLDIIGDMEFVRDDANIMQRIEAEPDPQAFIASVVKLSQLLQGAPLVFIELPDRGAFFEEAEELSYFGKSNESMIQQFELSGIDVWKVNDLLENDESDLSLESFFFRTDGHLPTEAEFYLAQQLTDYLADSYQVAFPATDVVYDAEQYAWKSYRFWGNFGRTAGRSFSGEDWFLTFEPLYKTDLKMTNPTKKIVREGAFSDVMLNGYSDPDGTENVYWVTNYGQYPSPYYKYENKLYPDGPDIMVISDSLAMRMNTFLALNASSVTVLDPRTFNGMEYVAQCLNENSYDAVIVCGSSHLFYSSSFASTFEIPEKIVSAQVESYRGMCLDKMLRPKEVNQISRGLAEKEGTITLTGWAADFTAKAPLAALYLQIGDRTLQCSYGIERGSVSRYFNNENLRMTGFEVSFPATYLDGVEEVHFIQVGADKSYRFEDVVFEFIQ